MPQLSSSMRSDNAGHGVLKTAAAAAEMGKSLGLLLAKHPSAAPKTLSLGAKAVQALKKAKGSAVDEYRNTMAQLIGGPYSKYLKGDQKSLYGHTKALVRHPIATLRDSAKNATTTDKFMIGAIVGSGIPGAIRSDTQRETNKARGVLAATAIGSLAFRRASILADLVGSTALAAIGSKAGDALTREGSK
jgi:hypothetical protein